jgi:hypothetical protein
MKNLFLFIAIFFLVSCAATQESIKFSKDHGVLNSACMDLFEKFGGRPGHAFAASKQVYLGNGKSTQACSYAWSGLLRSSESRMERALAGCEGMRAQIMQRNPSWPVVPPCQIFTDEEKIIWK